jgi:hypothetical protein
MEDRTPVEVAAETPAKTPRVPWNKGKLVGAKPPLRPSHVWSIRTKLQIEGKKRDRYLGIEVDDAIEIAEEIDI